jgi:hypothetical protein
MAKTSRVMPLGLKTRISSNTITPSWLLSTLSKGGFFPGQGRARRGQGDQKQNHAQHTFHDVSLLTGCIPACTIAKQASVSSFFRYAGEKSPGKPRMPGAHRLFAFPSPGRGDCRFPFLSSVL